MSLNKSPTRRLSLLAGSSLVAASLSAFSMTAPSVAFAANECGNPSANGAAADILTCTPGAYAAGIDYSTTSDGDLTVVLRDRVDTGTSNTAGSGPVRLIGKTGENMSLLREDTVNVVGDPRIINTTGTGRAIDVSTLGDGHILINLTDGDPTAAEPTTPVATAPAPMRIVGSADAIRADAQGTGNVSVILGETGTPSGTNHPRTIITAGATVGSNGSGVAARSTTGAITVDTRGATITANATNGGSAVEAVSTSGNVTVAAGPASGRLRGILAQTGGAGVISVTAASGASAAAGGAAIDTIAGTGATSITLTSGSVTASAGSAIRSVSTSTSATAAVNVLSTGATINGAVDFSGVTAGAVTFNTTGGSWAVGGASTFSAFNDTVTVSGAVGFAMAENASINLGAGNDTLAISSVGQVLNFVGPSRVVMRVGSAIDFGAGNDTFNLTSPRVQAEGAVLNFGAGADTWNSSSILGVDSLTVTGLETFNNTGTVLLGTKRIQGSGSFSPDFINTDANPDDVLSFPGLVTYTGSGNARIVMDVLLGSGSQASCGAPTGMADCLDLRGASTAGVTVLTVNYVGASAQLAGYDPVGVTVVDVAGAGTSAASHFVLDPDSSGYVVDPVLGVGIHRPGLFRYAFRYDAVNQRHVLVGLPRGEVMEYAMVGSAAQSIWHMTSQTVTDRQSDLRAATEGGDVWVRLSGETTRRNLANDLDSFGQISAFDAGYTLHAGSIIAGIDLMSGKSGGYDYVLGGQVGYVGSSFDLNASEATGRFTGATGGVYGSLWNGRYFLDTTLNGNFLTLDYDSPALSSRTNTYLYSFGAQAEGGFRGMLSEHAYVEPLATLAFVRTTFEEISLTGGEVEQEDTDSLRASLGLRFGADVRGGPVNISYVFTGRVWDEFEGASGGVIHNPGADLTFADSFDGVFGEAQAGLNLYDNAGVFSGFVTTGVKFKDGYEAVNLSAGVRMAW